MKLTLKTSHIISTSDKRIIFYGKSKEWYFELEPGLKHHYDYYIFDGLNALHTKTRRSKNNFSTYKEVREYVDKALKEAKVEPLPKKLIRKNMYYIKGYPGFSICDVGKRKKESSPQWIINCTRYDAHKEYEQYLKENVFSTRSEAVNALFSFINYCKIKSE